MVVDNSTITPIGLTVPPMLLIIRKLPLFHITSGEDCMSFHVFLLLLAVCLLLSLVLLWRLGWLPLQLSHSAVASRRSSVYRLLKPRTALDCLPVVSPTLLRLIVGQRPRLCVPGVR